MRYILTITNAAPEIHDPMKNNFIGTYSIVIFSLTLVGTRHAFAYAKPSALLRMIRLLFFTYDACHPPLFCSFKTRYGVFSSSRDAMVIFLGCTVLKRAAIAGRAFSYDAVTAEGFSSNARSPSYHPTWGSIYCLSIAYESK